MSASKVQPILTAENVTMRFGGVTAVSDLSLKVDEGSIVGVIGPNGTGKTTLFRMIMGLEQPTAGTFTVGQTVKLSYVDQQHKSIDPEKTVYEVISQNSEWIQLGNRQVPARAYVARFNFTGADQEKKCGVLSGGERNRLHLALALKEGGNVLLLDEPTNDLDVETLEWLEDFLLHTRLPVLYVSHDETLIERTANVIVHMEQLRRKTCCRTTVSRESYPEYLRRRANLFDRQEQLAQKQRSDYDKKLERWQQVYQRVEHEQGSISRGDPHGGRLLKKKMHSVQSQKRRFEREKEAFLDFPETEEAILARFPADIVLPAGKTVLDLSLPALYAGQHLLARDLRLHVSGGEHVGITGRNGAGKSTLLMLLWEALRDRRDITACCMPQDYSLLLDFGQTPIEHLGAQYDRETLTRARTYLGSMRFTHEEMTGKIAALSGGQRAKLLYLDMVLRRADVLLLDEPTRNFSPLSCPAVREALRAFGGTIIGVSHDRKYLAEVCDTVYVLDEAGLHRRS